MLAITDRDSKIHIWDANSKECTATLDISPLTPVTGGAKKRKVDAEGNVRHVCISSQGNRVVAMVGKHSLHIWELPSAVLWSSVHAEEDIYSLAMTASGEKIAVAHCKRDASRRSDDSQVIVVYNVSIRMERMFEIDCGAEARTKVSFSGDGSMIACAIDHPESFKSLFVNFWSTEDGGLLHSIPSQIQPLPGKEVGSKSKWYPLLCGGNTCLTAFGMIIESWNTNSGSVKNAPLQTVAKSQWKFFDHIECMCFGETEDIVVAHFKETIIVFDLSTGAKLSKWKTYGSIARNIGYVSASKAIVCVIRDEGGQSLSFLDAASFEEIDEIAVPTKEYGYVHGLFFSPTAFQCTILL